MIPNVDTDFQDIQYGEHLFQDPLMIQLMIQQP